jgi:hypothetical protein
MALFRSAKLVQIFLLSNFFCSKLTRYFTSEFFLKSLEKFLIAGVLLNTLKMRPFLRSDVMRPNRVSGHFELVRLVEL